MQFLENNPNTPAIHPLTGDQSWIFGDGRYRVFFIFVSTAPKAGTIYLTDIIDNRQANIGIYPQHKLPTYFEEE